MQHFQKFAKNPCQVRLIFNLQKAPLQP